MADQFDQQSEPFKRKPLPPYEQPVDSYYHDPPPTSGHAPFMTRQEHVYSSGYGSVEEVKESKRSGASHFMGWWVEVAGLVASVFLFGVIVVVLKQYNGKLQPRWQWDFNLNALIALLATFLRITMMDVVTKLMGQLKWNWFSKPRKLSQLETIDDGTRGPWAAFILVFKLRRPHPILLGGAITVLSLALGLFTQQSVTAVPCVIPVEGTNASIAIRKWIPVSDTSRIAAGLFEVDGGAKSTMLSGLTGTLPTLPVNCPGGNCTFPSFDGSAYSSIGLCTKCVDTSSKIKQVTLPDDSGWNFTLPDNATVSLGAGSDPTYIEISYGRSSYSVPGAPPWMLELDPTLATLSNTSLGYVSVISFTGAGCKISKNTVTGGFKLDCPSNRPDLPDLSSAEGIVSTSCFFSGCIKNYEASVTNGLLTERVVSTVPAFLANSSMPDAVGVKLPCLVGGKSYDMSNMSMIDPMVPRYLYKDKSPLNNTIPVSCIYAIDWEYTRGIGAFFDNILNGRGLQNSRQGSLNGMPVLMFYENWWLNKLYNEGLATTKSISTAFENLATSFTNYQRLKNPAFLEKYEQFNGTEKWMPVDVQGLVQTTSICNQFNWPWLLFPALLLVATAILFIITIIVRRLDDRDLPVWKTSLLPLLFYGLGHRAMDTRTEYRGSDADSGDRSHNLLGLQELTDIAKETTVRFRRSAQGGGFEELPRQGMI